jgi:hypothetical protein
MERAGRVRSDLIRVYCIALELIILLGVELNFYEFFVFLCRKEIK